MAGQLEEPAPEVNMFLPYVHYKRKEPAGQSVPFSVNSNITGICFANAFTGWAVGSNGVIVYSGDGGTNWSQQTSPTTRLLAKVWFINCPNGLGLRRMAGWYYLSCY